MNNFTIHCNDQSAKFKGTLLSAKRFATKTFNKKYRRIFIPVKLKSGLIKEFDVLPHPVVIKSETGNVVAVNNCFKSGWSTYGQRHLPKENRTYSTNRSYIK